MALQPSRSKRLMHTLFNRKHQYRQIDAEATPVFCRDLPAAFVGARIAVVADVHLPNAMMPLHRLLSCTAWQKPDAIFLPGDLTNSYTDFDGEGLTRLATGLAAIAPCFAIPGNHEWRLDREPLYRDILTASGVHYLCDSDVVWEKDGAALTVFGMGRRRPAPHRYPGQPTVVLAHRPEYFSYYQQARWDLVVCGHAHGGQIRIGDQGVFSPGQGVLPTYTDGIYTENGTTMVVSRGLGNGSVALRIANRPHLPVLLLMPAPTDNPPPTGHTIFR